MAVGTSMKRRRLLGTLAGTLAFAGCTSPTSETDGPATTDDTTQSTTDGTTSTPPGETSPDGTPETTTRPPETRVDSFSIGESVGDVNPLGVTIRNEDSGARVVSLQVTATADENELLDATYSVPPEGRVTGEIRTPADYEIRAAVPRAETETAETIEEGLFDTCNGYGTSITIGPGGELSSRTFTTLVKCSTATIETAEPGGE